MSRDRGAECAVEDCDNEPVSGSVYCETHLLDVADLRRAMRKEGESNG